jgi:hypothetical protein
MKRQVLDPDKARVIRLQADLVREEGFSVRSQIGRSDASSSTPPGCCRSSPNRLGARSPTSSTPKGTRCRLVARSPGRRSRRISPSACNDGSRAIGENAARSFPNPAPTTGAGTPPTSLAASGVQRRRWLLIAATQSEPHARPSSATSNRSKIPRSSAGSGLLRHLARAVESTKAISSARSSVTL